MQREGIADVAVAGGRIVGVAVAVVEAFQREKEEGGELECWERRDAQLGWEIQALQLLRWGVGYDLVDPSRRKQRFRRPSRRTQERFERTFFLMTSSYFSSRFRVE